MARLCGILTSSQEKDDEIYKLATSSVYHAEQEKIFLNLYETWKNRTIGCVVFGLIALMFAYGIGNGAGETTGRKLQASYSISKAICTITEKDNVTTVRYNNGAIYAVDKKGSNDKFPNGIKGINSVSDFINDINYHFPAKVNCSIGTN